MAGGRILIVEDEKIVAIHLVLMGILLQGDMNGIEAAREIQKNIDTPIIYITARMDEHTYRQANTTGPLR